jgi:hypothetical protein
MGPTGTGYVYNSRGILSESIVQLPKKSQTLEQERARVGWSAASDNVFVQNRWRIPYSASQMMISPLKILLIQNSFLSPDSDDPVIQCLAELTTMLLVIRGGALGQEVQSEFGLGDVEEARTPGVRRAVLRRCMVCCVYRMWCQWSALFGKNEFVEDTNSYASMSMCFVSLHAHVFDMQH